MSLYDAINNQFHWRDYAQDVEPALADLIDRLMSRFANQRPANTQAILQQLVEIERSMRSPSTPTAQVQPVAPTIPYKRPTPKGR